MMPSPTGGVILKHTTNTYANDGPKMVVDKWTEEHCPLIHNHDHYDGEGLFFPIPMITFSQLTTTHWDWAYTPHTPPPGGKHTSDCVW